MAMCKKCGKAHTGECAPNAQTLAKQDEDAQPGGGQPVPPQRPMPPQQAAVPQRPQAPQRPVMPPPPPDDEEERKSLPSEDDLIKAMDALEHAAAALAGPNADRKDALLAKASDGTLTGAESKELSRLLDAGEPAPNEDIRKSMREDTTIGEALDASEFLAAWNDQIVKSFDGLRGDLKRRDETDSQFKKALAKALHAQAEAHSEVASRLAKSLDDALTRIAALEGRPVSGWRGMDTAPITPASATVAKSFGAPSNDQDAVAKASVLNKSQAIAGLNAMLDDALTKGDTDRADLLGNVLIGVESCFGDWRKTRGITPELAGDLYRTLANGAQA